MANKKNQGKQFEEMIERAFDRTGPMCTVVKTDPPVRIFGMDPKSGRFTGCFKKPGQCDFEGGFHGITVCIEAKDTAQEIFLRDRIRPGQFERMDWTWHQKGISGLMIRFKDKYCVEDDGVYLIPYGNLDKVFDGRKRFREKDIGEHGFKLRYVVGDGLELDWLGLQSVLQATMALQRRICG